MTDSGPTPFEPVPIPRKAARKHLTMEEWRRLLAASSTLRDRTLLLLLYETGMRASEPGKLRLDHCKLLHEKRLWVPRGKGSTSSWFTVSAALQRTLVTWIDSQYPPGTRRRAEDPVFAGKRYRGRRTNLSRQTVLDMVKALCRDVDIPEEVAHPHAIRHARSVHLLEEADRRDLPYESVLQTIATILGHKAAATTLRYYTVELGRGKELADDVLALALGEDE